MKLTSNNWGDALLNSLTQLKKLFRLMLVAGLILLALPGYVSAQSASVSATSQLESGASGSASVSISAPVIGSFTLNVSCSPGGILDGFDSITPGTGLPVGFSVFVNGSGDSASISGFMTTTPITGGATVANFTFTAIGPPGSSTTINVSGDLYDDNGDPIAGITFTGAPVQVTAEYNLTMTMGGTGGGSVSPGDGPHLEGTVVPITATPADGDHKFINWTGDVGTVADVNAASTTITMDADKSITANFAPLVNYNLTMTMGGTGGGSVSPGDGPHLEGTVVPITATPADADHKFINWTGDVGTVADVNAASTTITMDADKSITANFAALDNYGLNMAINGLGTVSPGDRVYQEGTVVPISATPADGWAFVSWTGDVGTIFDVDSASTLITMDSDKAITANFIEVGDTTLTLAVNGNGSTSPPVGDHGYADGAIVPITATPDPGWQFDNWTGDVADPNSATTTVTMDANKTVTANFSSLGDIVLTIEVIGDGSTSPSVGDHFYLDGAVVPISAIPDFGWQFENWTGDVADPDLASTTVTMDAAKTISANFIPGGDIVPPVVSSVAASNITNTTADIAWMTDEPSDSQVDYEASPGILTPLDPTLVTQHLVTLTDLSPATLYRYVVMSRDSAGNLTVSTESTFTTLGLPAILTASGWNADVSTDDGLQVVVSFLANNTGDLAGSYQLTLTANNVEVETKQVDLSSGASNNVTFNTVNDISGTYTVTVDGATVLFSLEVPGPADGLAWWLLVVSAVGAAAVTAVIIFLIRRRSPAVIGTKGEFQFPSLSPKTTATTNELEEARLEAEEAKRAWREAQETRIEAEEAKEAVTKAASEAINEAKELKSKSKRELDEAKKMAQEAATAKRLYGDALNEVEEAKRAWVNARKAKKGGHVDERARVEAQESEERAARLIRKAEVGNTEAGEDKVEISGVTVTVRALEKLKAAIGIQTKDANTVVRIVSSPTDPNQFEMKLGDLSAGDRVLEREGKKILAFSPELESALAGITIDIRETADGVHFTMSRRTQA